MLCFHSHQVGKPQKKRRMKEKERERAGKNRFSYTGLFCVCLSKWRFRCWCMLQALSVLSLVQQLSRKAALTAGHHRWHTPAHAWHTPSWACKCHTHMRTHTHEYDMKTSKCVFKVSLIMLVDRQNGNLNTFFIIIIYFILFFKGDVQQWMWSCTI